MGILNSLWESTDNFITESTKVDLDKMYKDEFTSEEKTLLSKYAKDIIKKVDAKIQKLNKIGSGNIPEKNKEKYKVLSFLEMTLRLLESANFGNRLTNFTKIFNDYLEKEYKDVLPSDKITLSGKSYSYITDDVTSTAQAFGFDENSLFMLGKLLMDNIGNEALISLYKTSVEKEIETTNQEMLNQEESLNKQSNQTKDQPIKEEESMLSDIELGDKLTLEDGSEVYYLKTLTPRSIWVTDEEEDRFNANAEGYVLYIQMETPLEVEEVEDEDECVKEDLITGDTSSVVSSDISEIMFQAIKKWETQGKAKYIEKVGKGQLTKTLGISNYLNPEFVLLMDKYNKYPSFIYRDKMGDSLYILVTDGVNIVNYNIQVLVTNKWTLENFYKMFSTNEEYEETPVQDSNRPLREDYKKVAQEIYDQISTGGLKSVKAYFGANQFLAGENKPMTPEELEKYKGTDWEKDKFAEKGNRGYLQFKASGSKLKNNIKVKIALNGLDTYDISIIKIKPSNMGFTYVKQVEGVYFDDVFDVLKDVLG